MRKYWLILLMAVVVLSACTPAATATPTQENTATVLPPTATALTVANTPTGPTCKPFDLLNEVLPAADSRVPAVNNADWTTGPATALVTIIDYSDFQ
jgi:hypothetical protein